LEHFKKGKEIMNVYEATQERLRILFEEFDNIYVSFSGGKDSGVLLNLCIDYIRNNNLNRKIGVFHLDYEAQYTLTTDYVNQTLSENQDVLDIYRCCIPFKVTTCTSMYDTYWRPWENDKKEIWVSNLPESCYTEDDFDFYTDEMWDYEFQEKFSEWYHLKNNAVKTACLVGIRTQESLNRWRAIHSDRNFNKFKGISWTKKMASNVYNAYPIYDWNTSDIWVSNGRFGWSYNKLYDIFYQAGLSIDQMRVASPFLSTAQSTLKLYRVIEPATWGKLIGRVNGVNFTGIYGGTTAMGWKELKLPKGHTWKSYMEFLLSTLPEGASSNYKKKLESSIAFWRTRGGVLSSDVITKLIDLGVNIEVGEDTNYKTDKKPVKMEYLDDIDITEFTSIPTYKRMCICIIKNDHLCKYMGFSLTKKETELRKEAEEKYKTI
jgi:predicted phosphoadenosine phosphosulfate sulfurtransferase